MDILKLPFLLLLFLQSVDSKNHCPISYCGNNTNTPLIQYPFKLQGDDRNPQNCTYINLTCSPQNTPILNLPNSGDFYVRDIDYEYSIIKLYDPENCLPKRLMSLNLTCYSYPLLPLHELRYTFYSCPSELIAFSNFTVIDCLSNSSVATVATYTVSSPVMKKLYRCSEIVTPYVPVLEHLSTNFIGNQSDFILTWMRPACEICPRRSRGRLVPRSVVELAILTVSFVTIIMPFIICIGCCVHFVTMFRNEVATKKSNVRYNVG